MCRSMVDIQSAAAEIRRGKKKKETNHRAKIYILHRAAIIIAILSYKLPKARLYNRFDNRL